MERSIEEQLTERFPRLAEIRKREYRLQTFASVMLLLGGLLGMMMLTLADPGDRFSRLATVSALAMPVTAGIALYYCSHPSSNFRWAVWSAVGLANVAIVYFAASV